MLPGTDGRTLLDGATTLASVGESSGSAGSPSARSRMRRNARYFSTAMPASPQ
jgi:hypothetical protein